jgi:tRNA(adenine34) deaminase
MATGSDGSASLASTRYVDAMRQALALAAAPAVRGRQVDVPVGAIVFDETGVVIGTGSNVRERDRDPTGHAEIIAIRAAAASLGSWRLDGCALVVTLEPCTMCAGAIVLARVGTLVFGAYDAKGGAVGTLWDVVRDRRLNHRPHVVGGVLADESGELLRRFFAERR